MSCQLAMPWKWKYRWPLLAAIIVALPMLYFLSAMPVYHAVSRYDKLAPLRPAMNQFYAPVEWCRENSKTAARIMNWEYNLLIDTFGSPFTHEQGVTLPPPIR